MKIVGDQHFSEYLHLVKVSEVLGMTHSFTHATTMSMLSLEMDPNGTENITIVACMTTLLDSFLTDETGVLVDHQIDK